MNGNKRIAANVVYIYAGVILCMILTLFTVPVLLRNLGASDYGIYNLIAGVITMLSFFKGSMIISIQRFMNVAFGANNLTKINRIYTVGTILFLLAAVLITLIVELLGPSISKGYLNIEADRIEAATVLFQVLVISTFITTIGVSFDALFNVHEDMWLFSCFNIIEAGIRLISAYLIVFVNNGDRLESYAIFMVISAFLIFILKVVVCRTKYKNIRFERPCKEDITIAKDILSFIGWNLYSTLAKIFSTQGFAVVLNLFLGTTVNAAYGIANQINSALHQFTSSVEKAFTPQIMKSEGMKDGGRMVKLSLLSTKYCSLIYSFIAIPLLAVLPFVFHIWLGTPPDYTECFSRIIIIASIVSMLSLGLAPMLYAKGNIKGYLFWIGTLLIVMVFVALGLLKMGASVYIAISLFIVLEIISFFVRLYYCRKYVGLVVQDYLNIVLIPYMKVLVPTVIVVFLYCSIPFSIGMFTDALLKILIASFVFVVFSYYFGLNKEERNIVSNAFVKKTM